MFTEKDFIHVDGTRIVNQKGEAVMLRGTNLGGWLHREGWMDGAGACLLPLPVKAARDTETGVELELDRICRCNRLRFAATTGETFQFESSLDGENWVARAEGRFDAVGKSALCNMRPAPYIPGVNVYNEGVFVEGDTLHSNEFFAKYLRVSGMVDPQPQRYGDIDDFTCRRILEDRFGKERAEQLLTAYQERYITHDDLLYIKALGLNTVRLPVYWQELVNADGTFKPNAWENIDWLIKECRELELYIILDYHGAPGGNTMGSITAGQLDSNGLWTNPDYQKMSCDIWKAISNRYRDEPAIAIYDLLNEPCALPVPFEDAPPAGETSANLSAAMYFSLPEVLKAPVTALYQRLRGAVLESGDRHIQCMQLFADLELLPAPETLGWDNVVYQVHCYPLYDFRNHDKMAAGMREYEEKLREYSAKWAVPVLAGEFCCWGFPDIWQHWLDTLNELGIHWTGWAYKNTDPAHEDFWALWYGFDGEFADYLRDSYETILAKWQGFSTNHYKKHHKLEELFRSAAKHS